MLFDSMPLLQATIHERVCRVEWPQAFKMCQILAYFNEPIPGVMSEQGHAGENWCGEIDHPWGNDQRLETMI